MASRKPKPVEIKPISINPSAAHKPENEDRDDLENEQEDQFPLEQTLEGARAEDAANAAANSHQEYVDGRGVGNPAPTRIKLKWTDAMRGVVLTAIDDYFGSAGAMPSILDLFEIVKDDYAFARLGGVLNHRDVPLFSPQSLQAGVNAIRKKVAEKIVDEIKLNGSTDLVPLPSLARVQTVRTKQVTDARALGLLIANLPALRAKREADAQALEQALGNESSGTQDGTEA